MATNRSRASSSSGSLGLRDTADNRLGSLRQPLQIHPMAPGHSCSLQPNLATTTPLDRSVLSWHSRCCTESKISTLNL